MNNDNNFFNESNNYQQSSLYDGNNSSQNQNFSGVDNSYSSSFSRDNLGAVPEPDKRPGCLTSLLGFVLTIALIIILSVVLLLFGTRSAVSNGINTFFDSIKTVMYDEISNNTEMKEALELVDSEFSDFLPDKMMDDIADGLNDSLTNGFDSDNLLPELDYEYISDSMYEVTEKVVDKAIDGYIEAAKTDRMSEEAKLLDDFMQEVIGYDLRSAYLDTLNSYDSNDYSDEMYEKAKKDTLNTILPDVREEIDSIVYNDFKDSYEEAFEDVAEVDDNTKQYIELLNLLPTIMKGCIIVCVVIMLLQLIMYRQKYRAIRNFSVAALFTLPLFAGFYAIFNLAIDEVKKESVGEPNADFVIKVLEDMLSPFLMIAVGLFAAFIILFIVHLIMRSSAKRNY